MTEKESLTELLSAETSRRNTDLIASLILQKPDLVPHLMEIFLSDEDYVGWRAAWAIDLADEKQPGIAAEYFTAIVGNLSRFTSDGSKRSSLRMLSRHPVQEDYMGEMMRICFEWLISPKESVAVKVHSMEILYSISCREPDLKKELADSIEWRISEENPGFRSHGMKMLKKLHREMNLRKFDETALPRSNFC